MASTIFAPSTVVSTLVSEIPNVTNTDTRIDASGEGKTNGTKAIVWEFQYVLKPIIFFLQCFFVNKSQWQSQSSVGFQRCQANNYMFTQQLKP